MKEKNTSSVKVCLSLLLTFLCHTIYAQLSPFTINVTSSPQTCLGNGSLNFTVNGVTPGASIEFEVYLLPNTSQPVTTVTELTATGLVSGNYKVLATQTLNGNSNTASATATIIDNTVQLQYTLNTSPCLNGGTITVHVTSGNAVSYEIISGPETRPLQSTNVFTGLPLGIYTVRVYDNCGDAVVLDVNMQALPASLFIMDQILPDIELPGCDKITVGHSIGNNYPMLWPVTLTYTIYPPDGGASIILTKVVNEYSDEQVEYMDIPYYTQYYTYDLKMTDACGNAIIRNNSINKLFDFILTSESVNCNGFIFDIDMSNYKLPCTVSFLSAPVGFNPSSFNSLHPVFNSDAILYGTNANPIPLGNYEVQITDACEHTAIHTIFISDLATPLVNSGIGDASLCYGYFTIILPFNREIASAVIIAAPDNFGAVLPKDVMEFANGDKLTVIDIPAGSYTVILTDICGAEYTVEILIVAGTGDASLNSNMLSGCSENEGSIYLYSINYRLTSVIITMAPLAFQNALPFDGSMLIDQFGVFRTNALPAGNYSVLALDDCGNEVTYNFVITGYEVLNDIINVIPGCGAFDVELYYFSNNTSVFIETFWLQQYDEEDHIWKNPLLGYPYTEGDPMTSGNALKLNNNTVNYSLPYSGRFRVMRYFSVYKSQDPSEDYSFLEGCVAQIYEFTFYDDPYVNGAYAFPCSNGLSEVIIDAEGVPPLEYAITQKNGQPYVVNNGTNMAFTSLENAVYNFSVTDECGNIVNIQYDITNLKPLEIQQKGFCEAEESSLYVKSYTFLTYEWWKEGEPDTILSTTNTLDFPSFEAGQMGVYFLKIVSTTPGSCIDMVLEHTIELPQGANAGEDITIIHCDSSETINLNHYLSEGHGLGGVWKDDSNTGHLNGSIFMVEGMEPGIYEFSYSVSQCGISDKAVMMVDVKGPDVFAIDVLSGCAASAYTLSISNINDIQGAVIAWTGPDNFTSALPVADISGKAAGTYSVTITNAEGCVAETSVVVEGTTCMTPNGLSPNGDGLNDYFDLSNLDVIELKIFNRYGLIIYETGNYKKEWHGQTNGGKVAPTGTYYYAVTQATGKKITGWVYLQREL